jgi:hypothetical protein
MIASKQARREKIDAAAARKGLPLLPMVVAAGAALLALFGAAAALIDGDELNRLKAGAEFVAVVASFPAAIFALLNYALDVAERKRANLWRRREFVQAQIARIEAIPEVRAAMTMLDYWDRPIRLPGIEQRVKVTNAMLTGALAPDVTKLVAAEACIRDSFDRFFDAMDRLGVMRDAGLVSTADLLPYVHYWLALLDSAPRHRNPEFGPTIRAYIHKYRFDALERLMSDIGVATVSAADQDLAQRRSRRRS